MTRAKDLLVAVTTAVNKNCKPINHVKDKDHKFVDRGDSSVADVAELIFDIPVPDDL